MSFSARERSSYFEQLRGDRVFDLAVIGAGITGASVARDAALRGYSVALIDAQDFGAGTSSRSSRLIHGGLRYLEHAQFGLVFESLAERAVLARLARHVVRPLHFVFPVFRGDHRGLLLASVGMWLYDLLALGRNYRWHARLSTREVIDIFPALRADGLRGAVAYFDYQTDDARLVLENVLSARNAGAVALSHAIVEHVAVGSPVKVLTVRDRLHHGSYELRARAIVSAAGPWTDSIVSMVGKAQPWLRPTKGIHVVVPRDRLRVDSAMVMQHPIDGRGIFALPYYERTVIGTTDTDYDDDPADVKATFEDVNYLLLAMDHYFPGARVTTDDVISTWSGVRPLLAEDDVSTGAVSREHRIAVRDGVVIIAGGKLTTYRRMAAECVERAAEVIADCGGPLPRPAAPTDRQPLLGAVDLETDEDFDALVRHLATSVPAGTAQQLALSYGSRARDVMRLVRDDPRLGEPIVDELPFIWAQVVYAATEEMALSVDDALVRRIQILYRDRDQGLAIAPRAAELLGEVLGWSSGEINSQVERYQQQVASNRSWRALEEDHSSSLILD